MAAVWLLACLYGTLDGAMNALPRQLMSKHASMLEMGNNVREYLRTEDGAYLEGNIPYPDAGELKQRLSSALLRGVLPSNLINPNPPLPVVIQESLEDGFAVHGCPDGVATLGDTVYGSYGKNGVSSVGSISLGVTVPKGTREVELQVAGYPAPAGKALMVKEGHNTWYDIAPAISPGRLWETVTFRLKPNTTSFKITATNSSRWMWLAFSTPRVSNRHALGRWADAVAGRALDMLAIGLALMVTGTMLAARPLPAD
jgi:hypothetical protein